ncbi:hypothetical protein DsansV1_C36g0231771 [Dioscorea sansibarensis]
MLRDPLSPSPLLKTLGFKGVAYSLHIQKEGLSKEVNSRNNC